MGKDTILIICAHNDDQIIGVGGSMVKYKQEGKKVVSVVFSYGERSHPHLKPGFIRKERKREALRSDKILGCDGIIFLDVPEGRFLNFRQLLKARAKLKIIIAQERPSKIFTHNLDDPHPDHRAVLQIVQDTMLLLGYKGEIYTFNVWNPMNFRKRDQPKLVVNITDTFDRKVKAFLAHRSQKSAIISLLWNVYFQAIVNGYHYHMRYAEVFYRLK